MSQICDEIDELYKRQAMLMDYLGLEFDYDFDELKGIKEKNKAPEEPESTLPSVSRVDYKSTKKGRYIDFKEIDAKLREKNTVDDVNTYEREIMAMDLTENQKMAIREKIIDRRGVLLYKERHSIR